MIEHLIYACVLVLIQAWFCQQPSIQKYAMDAIQ